MASSMRQTTCAVFDCSDPGSPRPMASFGLDDAGDGLLGYGKRYIGEPGAFALDPVHLPMGDDLLPVRRRRDGSYGVLSDAGPNAWGVKLTSSINRKHGLPQPVTPVDWFIKSWHFGSGCLGFSQHHSVMPEPSIAAEPLSRLAERQVKAIEALSGDADAELDDEAIRLFFPGGSLGGVRPKTVVMHEGIEHIAKFSRPDDKFDVPAAEYATLRLAHAAGVNVTGFELVTVGSCSVLLVARFDRTESGGRIHYLSANTLIDIDAVDPVQYRAGYSYAGIAEALRPIDDHARDDGQELFRRMVLNILVGNVDDHMRNHALIMQAGGRYRLSPAFDIVPHLESYHMPQSIGVGADGAAGTMKNALSQCRRFLLLEKEARSIIDEVRTQVARWREVFTEAGVSKRDMQILGNCFANADSADRIQVAGADLEGAAVSASRAKRKGNEPTS
jgi:serine/threonine-protein kinase HipA